MIKEFKEFISRGNVIDLAVGVIIGGTFGKIVSSLVDDIIMPIWNYHRRALAAQRQCGGGTIAYGAFIQSIVDFFIIALCIFLIIADQQAPRKKKRLSSRKSEPSREELLLAEIRDCSGINRQK